MPRRSRLILTAVGAFALAAAAVTTTTGDAAAAVPQYVALGDSYASGTGTGDYIDDSNCLRSAANYSSLIAAARGYDLNLRACSGAEIPDVRGQLGALSASTDYVSLSVGGNDAGFSEVITEWLNGLSEPIVESYHPNKLGHADGFTPLVSAQLTGVAATADPAVLATAAAAAPAQAHRQQQYAAGDASIRPEVIRAPDLSTPEARAAAARAGVDLNSRASIDRADRIFSAQQAAAVDR